MHVSVDSHISNITTLQRFLNKQSALKPNSITFGVAQKMLNLYLKYEWCLGIIPETPHCPVDNAVLHEAGVKSKVRWSKMQQEDYSTAISQIEENVFPLRANEWELRMFNDKNRAYGVSVEKSGLAFRE